MIDVSDVKAVFGTVADRQKMLRAHINEVHTNDYRRLSMIEFAETFLTLPRARA